MCGTLQSILLKTVYFLFQAKLALELLDSLKRKEHLLKFIFLMPELHKMFLYAGIVVKMGFGANVDIWCRSVCLPCFILMIMSLMICVMTNLLWFVLGLSTFWGWNLNFDLGDKQCKRMPAAEKVNWRAWVHWNHSWHTHAQTIN